MEEIFKATSTNGRWGVAMVSATPRDEISYPIKGRLVYLGKVEGISTYRLDVDESGDWIVVGGDMEPVAGCTLAVDCDLQSSNNVSILVGGDFFAYTQYGYKRRSSSVRAFSAGKEVQLPATVMLAMGLIPCEETPVEVEIPASGGALQEALKKAGLA